MRCFVNAEINRIGKSVNGARRSRIASTALIAAAGIGVAKIAFLHVGEDGSLVLSKLFSIINWKAIVLALAIWYGLVKWKKHPILYIVVAAVAGIVFQFH